MTQSAGRLVLIALGLALVMAVELAAGTGVLKQLQAGELPWHVLLLAIFMIVASTGAIVTAFSAAMQPEPARINATAASSALAMLAGVETSHAVGKLPLYFHFAVTSVGEVVVAYCFTTVLLGLLRLSGVWQTRPPIVAGAIMAGYALIGFVGQNFIALETVARTLSLLRDAAILLAPAVVLACTGLYKPLRLDAKSIAGSIRLRLPSREATGTGLRTFALCLGGGIVDLGVNAVLWAAGGAAEQNPLLALGSFSFAWLGLVGASLLDLAAFTSEQKHGSVTARLATSSARRFLKRHLTEQQAWAATVGLKTSSFNIDHDPGSVLHQELPASIMQIRAEEIQRCVADVLGPMYLHSSAFGQRLFGALDPEVSVRPCVDALKMFAALYLDAGPLVERRIKGLASLLPIVDPGLAKILRHKDISSLIRRNLWFFYFDFGWIDQHVIHTPRSTRYDVRIATLSSRIRHSMIEHLEKTGGIGNYVWLGPEARDRLIQEAPTLKNIIEACPIPGGAGGADELLMFVIKFEQLIPRLQRYFDLDSMRRVILDFEPSPESARLLNLLGLQIAKTRTPEEVLEVLASITTVPWKGFKEKDHALQLILHAYDALSAKVAGGQPLYDSSEPKHRALYDKILDAVRLVGYPSQILHAAQQRKIALRDVATLRDAAANPGDPRFHEAWLMLSATDFSRHAPEQRKALLEFLRDLDRRAALTSQRIVQIKAVDAVASLGRAAGEAELLLLREAFNRLGGWFAQRAVDPDICCLYLDAHTFLATAHEGRLELSREVVEGLDRYFKRLGETLGASDPKLIAVNSRWQEIRAKNVSQRAASEAAA
jgi:hypothetical protein